MDVSVVANPGDNVEGGHRIAVRTISEGHRVKAMETDLSLEEITLDGAEVDDHLL